jgi:hypothetical protein
MFTDFTSFFLKKKKEQKEEDYFKDLTVYMMPNDEYVTLF